MLPITPPAALAKPPLVMSLTWLLLLCLLAFATSGLRADELPPVPDPQKLAPDWWTYFEPEEPLDEDGMQERAKAATTFFTVYRQRLPESDPTAQREIVDKLLADMSRLQELKLAQAPVSTPTESAAASYTLEQALERHEVWRSLKQQIDAEREEADWQDAVIAEESRQQSRRRSRYLAMDATDPSRTLRGLELMLSRFGLERRRLELERRKKVLREAEERLASLQSELKVMPERLVAAGTDRPRWRKQLGAAEQAVARLRGETDASRLSEPPAAASSQGLSESQYGVLVAVREDAEIRLNELLALQARLALRLIALLDPTEKAEARTSSKLLADNKELDETLDQQYDRWRHIAERGRGLAATKDLGQPDDPETKRILNRMADTLEALDEILARIDQQASATRFIAELLSARQQEAESWLARNLSNLKTISGESWSTASELLRATLFEINEAPVTTLGLLRVVLILTIALWLSKGIRRAIERVGERRGGASKSSLYTFGRLVHYVILTIGIIVGLSSIGIDFTKFALFASALGVGLGFSLQTLISNFVAGLIILFEKSLKVGDFVELESGVAGEVREINMRSTLIATNDNIDILVPNSELVGGRMTNWTLREVHRRVHIPFGVAYGTDKEVVRTAVLAAADKVPFTLHGVKGRQPEVWLVQFGDSSLSFELIVWLTPEAVKRPGTVHAAYLWEIDNKLREYGIEVPFPQRDLHLRSLFGMKDEQAADFLSRKGSGG